MSELIPDLEQPAARDAIRRGKHVAALFGELRNLPEIVKRYRMASHTSTERARRRVLACARIVTALEIRSEQKATKPRRPRGMAVDASGALGPKF